LGILTTTDAALHQFSANLTAVVVIAGPVSIGHTTNARLGLTGVVAGDSAIGIVGIAATITGVVQNRRITSFFAVHHSVLAIFL
jgi:hypothetical protein